MFGAGLKQQRRRREPGDLFARIGELLSAQGLSPDPANYAFAHHLLSREDGEALTIVARILDDGVRLSGREIEAMGGRAAPGAATTASDSDPGCDDAELGAHRLVEQTRVQADAVAAMIRTMHDETRDFGRTLARSAAQFDAGGARPDPGEIVRLTAAMVHRAADAEERLASATREADALRAELAEAQATARCDPLTGLPNRRAFDEAFGALDPAVPHCLALCDIDRFKRVNDRFGHLVGDRVLVALARLLSTHCEGHLVTRHGGEEFALLLSGVDLAAAATLVDGARAAMAGRRLRDRDSGEAIGAITFSAGVVAVTPGEPREAVIARADALLYRAKEQGRERVLTA